MRTLARRRVPSRGRALLVMATLLWGISWAQAQTDSRANSVTAAMSEAVYRQLSEVQELLAKESFAPAKQKLDALLKRKRLSPYERAQAWNVSGYLEYLRKDYTAAIAAYDEVLNQGDIPDALAHSTLKTLSQLRFVVEDYPAALATAKRLMAMVPQPGADLHMLVGQAHFQMKQYDRALPAINKAVALYRAQGIVPKENWLLLLRAIHHEQNDYALMLAVMRELMEHYPKDEYLRALAGIYSELGDTSKQLAVSEALYERGVMIQPHELVNLANLYLLHELPYKAAKLLDKEVESGRLDADLRTLRLLSQSWFQAREDDKAVVPLTRAAELADDGNLYLRLAQSRMNLGDWQRAAQAAQAALKKGGLSDSGHAWLVLGIALFNQQRLDEAENAFRDALQHPRNEVSASRWLAYVAQERRRLETLDQALPRVRDTQTEALMEELRG